MMERTILSKETKKEKRDKDRKRKRKSEIEERRKTSMWFLYFITFPSHYLATAVWVAENFNSCYFTELAE